MKQFLDRHNMRKKALPLTLFLAVIILVIAIHSAPSCFIKLSSSIGIDEVVYDFEMTDDREVVLKSFLGRTVATYQQSTEPIATNVLCDPTFIVRPIVNNDINQDAQPIVKRKSAYGVTYWRDGSEVIATAMISNGKVFVLFYD